MDRRDLSIAFRQRFRQLLAEPETDIPRFLRKSGLDRSALSQLRDPRHDRLPRAETLRKIADATGVSVDWLLARDNAREGQQEMTKSNALLAEDTEKGVTPLTKWHAEAAGHKIRYVPATLPDMLSLSAQSGGAQGEEAVLTGINLHEIDLEIAMPIQTLQALSLQQGVWASVSPKSARQQLNHIAMLCDAHYPALRLHLFDGATQFTAPFTVFGRIRAAVYVGNAYVSVTSSEEVQFFTKQFDTLVRAAVVTPDIVAKSIKGMLQG